ncbi:MAG: hypothetical protein Q8904_09580 [Bacteroidota bacterium]|nr:hypothetical protein [Bacteroidota bacterium]
MKTKKIQASASIRFRRWSRAGYAVFCSLACAVTIGCVCVSISDKSLQKSTGITESSRYSSVVDSESKDKPDELIDLEATLHLVLETSLFENLSERAAACGQNANIYFINQNG